MIKLNIYTCYTNMAITIGVAVATTNIKRLPDFHICVENDEHAEYLAKNDIAIPVDIYTNFDKRDYVIYICNPEKLKEYDRTGFYEYKAARNISPEQIERVQKRYNAVKKMTLES